MEDWKRRVREASDGECLRVPELIASGVLQEAASEECRPVEADMIESPRQPDIRRPDLRCSEHGGVCEAIHSLLNRVMDLESRVRELGAK